MDPFKAPSKGASTNNNNKQSANNFSIRFNANDDSLDDIYNTSATHQCPSASLLPIPPSQQNPSMEESIWKRDFLQAGFFTRKRSNSTENLSVASLDLSSNHPANPSPSPAASSAVPMDTTTWARFKGKVNQAMEDIKSSSSSANPKAATGAASTAASSVASGSHTAQSSISEDYVDPESEAAANGDADNSDDDVDSEIFNGAPDELEPPSSTSSRLKRSIRHIRSNKEAIKGSLRKAKETTKDKMFGRSKRTEVATTAEKEPSTRKPSGDVDIESGVEMVEDMVIPASMAAATKSEDHTTRQQASDDEDDDDGGDGSVGDMKHYELHFSHNANKLQTDPPSKSPPSSSSSSFALLWPIVSSAVCSRNLAISLALLAVLLVLPIPPFLQGVIACLCSIVTISTLYQTACSVVLAIVSQNNPLGPQRTAFSVPDYDRMSVCEIPAAEEHTSLKSYCGWLNEISHYDPDNYHLGLMKSVLVRLDGSRLKVSNVTNRVPKRSMWNEAAVDRKHLIVSMNRTFDLRHCRVEMMPKGLARKRYFNRKYPMQLIIPNGGAGAAVAPEEERVVGKGSPKEGEERTKLLFHNDFDSTDFGTTILSADTSALIKDKESSLRASDAVTPSSDEVRLIFFARCDREKEDWFRRFLNASVGAVRDNENPSANYKYVTEVEAQGMRQVTQSLENLSEEERQRTETTTTIKGEKTKEEVDEEELQFPPDSQFDGLLMTPCSARSHPDYVKFMAKYQSRRERKEDDLWKGIDQSLFLGPTVDVIWANVLIGRVLYSCLNNDPMLERIQDFLQKKLSAIKLPNFMEDVAIAQLHLGNVPPLVHRVSQPLMDERGTWIDADLTYEGLVHATVTTKLNLLRLRRQQGGGSTNEAAASTEPSKKSPVPNRLQMSSIYDSDAESTGGSSSESEGSGPTLQLTVDSAASAAAAASQGGQPPNGTDAQGGSSSSRKLLRFVDKITASNLFQSATEISLVQRAMENMSTRIKLRVELKGLVARVVLNIPPPPSDRIWVGFRGPPRLWITAKPALGEHSVDWSLVTNVIENKLCEEVYKYLVYPNMVDVIVPILGQSTYKEDE